MADFNLEQYLTNGVTRLIQDIARASLKNPKVSVFMAQYALAGRAASQKRQAAADEGRHIPPFLIASVTAACNLRCKGCYAWANHTCTDSGTAKTLLSAEDWSRIFDEAEDLGVAFILLAGGEPFLRQDVLQAAGRHKKILFPVFTNGTLLAGGGMRMLARYPNLLPVLSLEGDQGATDARRGPGTYVKLIQSMSALKKRSALFGCSVTVQKRNLHAVLSSAFVQDMAANGCRAIIYVEYVPVDAGTQQLAPGQAERDYMADRLAQLRLSHPELIFISFPGDEQSMGGCLAAGRGFFHINPYGGAEPCPFSAYSDCTLKNCSLEQALHSPLFIKLRGSGVLEKTHTGGCTLFRQQDLVKALQAEDAV